MWLVFAICSALLLGVYDVAKKQALKRNGVLWLLLMSSALSTLLLSPFLESCPQGVHLQIFIKALLVSVSWISGLIGLKKLPITTASTIKASRPVIVFVFSLILFGERLNIWQWTGVLTVLAALFLLSRASRSEGIDFKHNRGVAAMVVSVFAGAASALYDKHIISGIDPLVLQSWSNLYITGVLAATVLTKNLVSKEKETFRPDWLILLIAVLISVSDALYFYSIKQPGSLLSVVSLLRRSSIIVTFVLGALIFKERNIRAKALVLSLMMVGIILLVAGSA